PCLRPEEVRLHPLGLCPDDQSLSPRSARQLGGIDRLHAPGEFHVLPLSQQEVLPGRPRLRRTLSSLPPSNPLADAPHDRLRVLQSGQRGAVRPPGRLSLVVPPVLSGPARQSPQG